MSKEKVIVVLLHLLGSDLGHSLERLQAGQLLLDERGRNVGALISKLRGSRARDFFRRGGGLHGCAETEGRRVNLERLLSCCIERWESFKGGSVHGV